jgi:DNA processing protein
LVVLGDRDYSPLLVLLADAPSSLGDVACLATRAVAVAGGRNASAIGQRIAEELAADLATAGLVVVSGMARAIEAAAHDGTLSSALTVAVVAGCLDVPYPPERADLQREVAEAGVAVTEAR